MRPLLLSSFAGRVAVEAARCQSDLRRLEKAAAPLFVLLDAASAAAQAADPSSSEVAALVVKVYTALSTDPTLLCVAAALVVGVVCLVGRPV